MELADGGYAAARHVSFDSSASTPNNTLHSERRYTAQFIGSTSMDHHFTTSMLPWVLAEIRRSPRKEYVTLEITGGLLISYRASDGQELSRHHVRHISRFAQTSSDRRSFMYLVNEKQANTPIFCFLYKMDNEKQVGELFGAVKEEKSVRGAKLGTSPAALTRSLSLCGDSDPNLSHFYEVLFLGKIKASHKRAPPTFIDDALQKFEVRENNKAKKRLDKTKEEEHEPVDGGGRNKENCEMVVNTQVTRIHPLMTPDNQARNSNNNVGEDFNEVTKCCENSVGKELSSVLDDDQRSRTNSVSSIQKIAVTPSHQDSALSESTSNRTMLLQIGRTDLRLISPDKRQVLLHKSFKEISHCSSGLENKEHFGFICKEASHDGYIGYVFKCENPSVVVDIMQGLKSAFTSAHESSRKDRVVAPIKQCATCPMVWFNQLCADLEGLGANKAQSVLLRSIEQLEEGEKEDLLAKMQGAETPNIEEQNQILMMLLRANCEVRQQAHEHTGGGVAIPPQTPSMDHNGGGLSEAANRAKRSLATTFNGIIRRKASQGGLDLYPDKASSPPAITVEKPTPMKVPHPLSLTNAERRMAMEKSASPDPCVKSPLVPLTPDKHNIFRCEVGSPGVVDGRRRAGTVSSAGGETMKRELARRSARKRREEATIEETLEKGLSSPMMSIFLKTNMRGPGTEVHSPASRQHIFQKVVTPRKSSQSEEERKQPVRNQDEPRDYKEIWQNAIKQQILLIRMDKENKKMQENAEILAERKLKLEYTSLVSSTPDICSKWDELLEAGVTGSRVGLAQAVSSGVPKSRRGEVWQLLVQMEEQRTPPPDSETDRFGFQYDQPYSVLKSQLTSHQHAILIDLGRTFPNHPYFSGALGPGQLGLFNLLKAYSILDTEVGYCQGLPFLGGLLLMHLDEEVAFSLLKHIMFGQGLRRMFKPDMTGLQVYMYQLTRLLAETQPTLYRQLDRLEVDPSLYSTPWFLTLFAAHFPLGFVTRVFDLLLLEGPHAIIKVGVCLLVEHANSLMECESLEELMDVIKHKLPEMPEERMEDVIKQAAGLNISRQLRTYEVEYHVLQEELAAQASAKAATIDCLTVANAKMKSENSELLDEIKSKNFKICQLETEVTAASQLQQQAQQQEQLTKKKLQQTMQLLEQLKPLLTSEAPDNIRMKLIEILDNKTENENVP